MWSILWVDSTFMEGCYLLVDGILRTHYLPQEQRPIRLNSVKTMNRVAHRHYGGANYLFGDFHAERSATLRQGLGCDWDLNGVHDPVGSLSAEWSGCPHPVSYP